MLLNESDWIGNALSALDVDAISPLINLGSATQAFRTTVQPHIHNDIMVPLGDRNVRVIHSDLFSGEGVDVAGSIYDESVLQTLVEYKPNAVLCSNMFEHVTDRGLLADSLTRMLPAGGMLIVTVPHSFPYHPDPIDTYYRPNLEDLQTLLPEFELVHGDIVKCGSLIGRYRASKKFMAAQMLGSLIPYPPSKWIRNVHHWLWLFRQYKVACGVFRKRGPAVTERVVAEADKVAL